MDILVMVGQLILGLTILVGLHELGHMLTAKWFGMRVEKYAIGFPPKVVSKQIGETEYMIGAIPLGGFVKISGMIDESLDTAAISEAPKPYEFRAKPAWQRLIVMMGGILVNVITGIIIFILLTYQYGEPYLPTQEVKFGVVPNELGTEMGFRTGDKIVAINGQPFENFEDIYEPDVLLAKNGYYTVDRGGRQVRVDIPADLMDKMADNKDQIRFVEVILPFKVGKVSKGDGADEAGVQAGDRIVQVGNTATPYFHNLQQALRARKGQVTPVVVERGGKELTLKAQIDENGLLGFKPEPLLRYSTVKYSFAESIPIGTEKAFSIITANIKGFAKIFRGEVSASKSLSGPIGIAQVFGDTFTWQNFWFITGMLSMVLAFMNFLPIPALDGGHVLFLSYEMISGQKPSDKFLENAQKVGMVLLLGLMAFAIFNDVFKLIF
ncbi:MAG: RIP metalloprotease RseP [Adhaeribacter sp.]